MYLFFGIPLVLITAILQTTIITRLTFENGTANLLLIFIIIWGLHERSRGSWLLAIIAGLSLTLSSNLPVGTYILSFLLINLIVRYLNTKIWKSPLLILIVLMIIGTLIEHTITYIALVFTGQVNPIGMVFSRITIPSVILNLVWAFPVFIVLNHVLNRLFPSAE